jgi:hypothetical protein
LALQIKESSKENMKVFGNPVASISLASYKHSPARVPSQTWGGTLDDLMSHAGSQKHTEFAGNLSPVPSHETSAYGGLEIGKHSQSMNMSTCDIGSSSTEGGYELDTGETCFLGAGMLLADQGCGEGPISVDDLPDIQVPGLDGTEPDLLFHIPSNMMSFQQAELLQRPTCKEEMESNQVVDLKISRPHSCFVNPVTSSFEGLQSDE